MNFRITILFFGLLLTTLFVFGLMIAHKKTAVAQTALVPSLADGTVKKIVITPAGKDAAPLEFVTRGDRWYYKKNEQEVRVEGFRVKEMIEAVKNARPEEDIAPSSDLAQSGLAPPQITVELFGKLKDEDKKWTFLVGKERPGSSMYYVNSPDKDEKGYAVPKRSIEALFIKDVAAIRAKRLFDFVEGSVTGLDIQKGKEKLEIKKQEGNTWVFVEPKLGFIGIDSVAESPPPPEDKFHPKKMPTAKEEPTPLKTLLGSIVKITVDDMSDFEPLGPPLSKFKLDEESAPLRIKIFTIDEAKNPVTDTLLIGAKVVKDKETYYYARLTYDDGVFKINGKFIKPIDDALADPGKLRSLDVAAFDPKGDDKKRVDYVFIKNAKDEVKFFFPEVAQDPWEMFLYDASTKKWEKKKANDPSVTALVDHMVGKKAIVEFLKIDDADKDKKIAEWGLKAPSAEIALYINVIERPKKDEKDKKDEKENKDKKADKDKKDQMPEVKKEAKPIVKLEFGNLDKDGNYFVRRTLEGGVESYFTLKKEFLEKIIPERGIELAYLDTELPTFSRDDVLGLKLVGVGDKSKEPIELERHNVAGKDVWYIKDPLEKPAGLKLAASDLVGKLLDVAAHLKATKWIKKLDAKEDLDKYGLKNPSVIVTVKVKKHATGAGTLLGALAGDLSVVAGLGSIVAHYQLDKGSELITIEFGKEAVEEKGKEKEKPGVYAKHSKSDLLFVVPKELVKFIKDAELSDRASMTTVQARIVTSQIGIAAGEFTGAWMFLSPYFSGEIHHLDPDKIKKVRLTIRTPAEVRSFVFERTGKGKDATWFDRTPGLVEFNLDSDKVAQLVKDFAKLRTERYFAIAGGQRSEHKLNPENFTAKLELMPDEGPVITVLIGTNYQAQGYYATSSYWPQSEAVFLIADSLVDPLLRGLQHFAKERGAVN